MTAPTPHDPDDDPTADDAETTGPVFSDCGAWVEGWLRDSMAGRFGSSHRWCAQWWKHQPVAVRLDALWQAWEAAVANSATDGAVMSAWWVYHADAHWRAITAPDGPLYQCTPEKHTDTRGLPGTPPPPGWFDTP